MIEVHKKTMEEFMGLYVDYWQFLHLPSELRIKKKERDFMVHTMSLNARGLNINSSAYVKEMVKRLSLKKANEIYNYRTRLKRKGFLFEKEGVLFIPQGLNVKEVPEETFFRFKVFCGEPTQLRNQRPVREVTKMGDLHRRAQPQPKSPKLPDYEQNIPAEQQIPAPARQEPFSVKLPVKLPPPSGPDGDPLREITKVAAGLAREQRAENMVHTPEALEGKGIEVVQARDNQGYSSEEYQDFDRNRDQSKLPPISVVDDGSDGSENMGQGEDTDPDVVSGKAGMVPAPVQKGTSAHLRPTPNIIDLD